MTLLQADFGCYTTDKPNTAYPHHQRCIPYAVSPRPLVTRTGDTDRGDTGKTDGALRTNPVENFAPLFLHPRPQTA